ncbi:MAG: Rrf2 family transcriptional regulator [Deltaproteobacteria bacterium]|nr:Rrf2 family transcriptional regulator [Deltaproteobacteria bacterium]MCB9786551.1 Rrf2 family transcriptional regulator [Deltaproteobacteria bacterium]
MLKLNRKTEYALLALRYMVERGEDAVSSVREIAAHYNIPEMLLAKVLQRLKHGDLVTSVKGSAGGYALARPAAQMGLVDVLGLFNEQTHLVDCMDTTDPCDCQQQDHCDIRQPMEALNALISEQLRNFTLDSFFRADMSASRPRYLSIYRREPGGDQALG